MDRAETDTGFVTDFCLAGPAITLTPGAGNEIGVDGKLNWVQLQLEDIVEQNIKVFRGSLVIFHSFTFVRSSIQSKNLAFGMSVRDPIFSLGKP